MNKPFALLIVTAFLALSVPAFAAGGKTLYKSCSACHGKDGRKKALRVSPPLKGQKADELFKKMKGYQDGTYGGKKKVIMKRNVAKLSDEELQALAEYISTL
ncbi:MAG: c-type cytochrome [Acidobacteria bacterium]|nr:c-type cytochrome [Acidobacteriota bacterium]